MRHMLVLWFILKLKSFRSRETIILLFAGNRYLLFGSNVDAMKSQFLNFFSEADWQSNKMLQVRVSCLKMLNARI